MPSIDDIYNKFKDSTDEEWIEILIRSLQESSIDGVLMPTFPHSEVQVGMQGSSGESALRHAFQYAKEVKAYAAFCGRPMQKGRALLDFGTGWGRIIRMFMRDLDPRDLYGVEPEPENILTARIHNPYVNFVSSGFLEPLPLSSGKFDYITAFSVFSHLDEHATGFWMNEFHRLLRPGGIVVFTTMPRDYLNYCSQLRNQAEELAKREKNADTHVKLSVAAAFEDIAAAELGYEEGRFLFSPSMGLPPSSHARWGWTIISREYIKREWKNLYHLIDFVEDGSRLDQAIVILQKPYYSC